MKRIIVLSLILFLNLSLFSHPWKPTHYVIIDTDGGIDDIRAITMLLASPDVRVLAIIVSPGTMSAENAYIKVKSLLNSFYHEGIPVGINRTKVFESVNFQVAKEYIWGKEIGIDPNNAPDYLKVIRDVITFEKTKVSFICLGGMTTAATALKEIPGFRTQVTQFVWSCNGLKDTKGFNFSIDRRSSLKMLNQEIPVTAVTGKNEPIIYDQDLTLKIGKVNTPYAKKITEFLLSSSAKNHQYSQMFTDELIPLFLHFPGMFTNRSEGINSENLPDSILGIKDGFIKILSGETAAKNQVIKNFPLSPDFFFSDIEPSVREIVEKYGEDEWIAGVIANELHRHLGVFAIVGVKMGIRAREYFDTGVDEFRATTFAGSIPPLSCMNDGIQVSTGATPGHGLLTVINELPTSPSVEFTYLNRKIRLTLKPEIAAKITKELKDINFVYGLDSNIYWELVRKNSIKYWLSLDRHEIFEIEEIE